jgi:hypothetical protein
MWVFLLERGNKIRYNLLKGVLFMTFGKVLILGDSYSTFEGFIPSGYDVYYKGDGSFGTGITKVEETWWHKLLSETDSELDLNDSWSGSTISYIGYDNVDCSKTSSFIYRLEKLCGEGFFAKNKIDTLLIFGGTNDSWLGTPLGEAKYENFAQADFYNVLPAICYLVKKACEVLPTAKVYFIINNELKPEIIATIKDACEKFGADTIQLSSVPKVKGHPDILGMEQIKNQILLSVKK